MLFDRTCAGPRRPGLSDAWRSGAALYRLLDRFDAWTGVATWREGLAWLATIEPTRSIAEVQLWSHGKWGALHIAGEPLGREGLATGQPHHEALMRVRARLAADALFWFRTCETFGGESGHAFARAWTEFFRCRAAGHTYVIGFWQSGLHLLRPGAEPHWPVAEGFAPHAAAPARQALSSAPWAPNTVTCLHGRVPEGF